MKNLTPQRVAAVDVFRALTMFLMLFVNDIPGLKNIPHWLKHAEMHEDMLGFPTQSFPHSSSVWVCPFPLLSEPLSKGRHYLASDRSYFLAHGGSDCHGTVLTQLRRHRGRHLPSMVLHTDGYRFLSGLGGLSQGRRFKKYLFIAMKVLGVALLAFLVLYKDLNGKPFHQGWWGILGLIGWTYVVCAGIYLFTRESLRKNVIAWLVVMLLAVISHSSLIPQEYGLRVILLPFIPSDWTLHAFGMSGVLTSLLMQKYADREHPRKFITILCVLGVVMLIAALCSHPHWIISKIQATPSWLFYCLAAFFPLFGLFYWLTDVKGKTPWFDIIKPAGTATLTCYILPYIWYAVQQLLGLHYPELLNAGAPGLLRSLIFSLIIVQLTGLLVKVKIKLKV